MPQPDRRAFTLVELVVSIGILVLMMSLAGQVFNFTVKSTGQATALTEVSQRLRAFEHTLREDLRHVQPGNSLLLIQGNPVNAYWTEADRDADADGDARPETGWYPHPIDPDREDKNGNLLLPRADILMFYTARKGASYINPKVTSHLQQVVYGHAEMGEYVLSGGPTVSYDFESTTGDSPNFPTGSLQGTSYPNPDAPAMFPAERWHLARRGTLLLPTPAPAGIGIDYPLGALDTRSLLFGESDAIGEFRYEDEVLTPAGSAYWYLPAVLSKADNPPYARSQLDPTPPALLADRLGHYALPDCASFKVEWSLDPRSEFVAGRLDGFNEVFWFDPGDPGDPTDPLNPPDPLRSLADGIERETDTGKREVLTSLLTRRSADGSIKPNSGLPIEYSLADRFRGPAFPGASVDHAWPQLAPDGIRPNLVVFTAARLGPRDRSGMFTRVPDAVFPDALRITVDVYDEERRLDRPIRHVMVIPVGG